MRYITEQELRDAFVGGAPETYTVPPDARLTPAARQYLTDLRLYRPNETQSGAAMSPNGVKPEYMTHLDAGHLVAKTHPRITLRGKLDSLEAEILVLQAMAQSSGETALAKPLEDALTLTRRVLAAEVTGKPLGDWTLNGQTPEQVHQASHQPQQFGFSGHILPDPGQGMTAALLNCLRAHAREAELAAAAAFCAQGNACERIDLLLALNRLSSYFYVLQLQEIRRREG